jgi:hypothetical protein
VFGDMCMRFAYTDVVEGVQMERFLDGHCQRLTLTCTKGIVFDDAHCIEFLRKGT